MARIRTTKPEFWTSAQVLECSRNARLLFIGLWNFADDKGRHPDSAKQAKAEVFPADDLTNDDVARMLNELSANGLILRYVVGGKGYFEITGWHHQRIDKPQPPKYPGPDEADSETIPGMVPPDTIGVERKGKDSSVANATAPTDAARPDPPDNLLEIPLYLVRSAKDDPKTALFRNGLAWLSSESGKPPDKLRSLLGKWLKATGDDARAVFDLMAQAQRDGRADPLAWVTACVSERSGDAPLDYAAIEAQLQADGRMP